MMLHCSPIAPLFVMFICYLLSAICYLLSAICYLLSAICCLLSYQSLMKSKRQAFIFTSTFKRDHYVFIFGGSIDPVLIDE